MKPYRIGKRFGVLLDWHGWTFGFQFGPEVWSLCVGPLVVWFDPMGLHDGGVEDLSDV